MVPEVKPVIFLTKAETPLAPTRELNAQFSGICPPSVVPQYIVTVGLFPPVAVMFPFRVAVVLATLVAGLRVIVGGENKAVKFKEAIGHAVPPLLVALAVKKYLVPGARPVILLKKAAIP